MADKTFKIKLDYTSTGPDAAAAGAKKVADNLKDAEKAAKEFKESLQKIREGAERLRMVGTAIAGVGVAISAPLILAVNTYVNKIGEAGVTSRAWLQATKDIETAQVRIGRVAATELLPYLQEAAKLAGQVAGFIEKNPDAVKAALIVGGTATAAGGALVAVSTAVSTGTALIQVLSSLGIVGTATGTGTAAAGLTGLSTAITGTLLPALAATAAIAGMAVGMKNFVEGFGKDVDILSNNILASSDNFAQYQAKLNELKKNPLFGILNPGFYEAKDESSFQAAKQLQKQGAAGWQAGDFVAPSPFQGYAPPSTPAINADSDTVAKTAGRTAEDVKRLADQMGKLNELYAQADELTGKRLEAERKGAADMLKAEEDYQAARLQKLADFQLSEARTLEDFTNARLLSIRDYNQAEAQASESYYTGRMDKAAAFGDEALQAEADHQKELRRMAEDSQLRIQNLAGSRDAYGIMLEMQNAEKERQRKEEDYRDTTGQRNKAYAEEITAQEKQFAKEKQLRDTAFNQRLADERAAFDLSTSRRKSDFDRANAAELSAYTSHRRALQAQTDGILLDITRTFNALQSKINQLAGPGATLPTSSTGTSVPVNPRTGVRAMAEGGYLGYGLHLTGERGDEYALNARTTRALEARAGSLTQDKVLRLAGGVNLSQSFNISGADNPAKLVEMIRRETAQVVTQVFEGMRA